MPSLFLDNLFAINNKKNNRDNNTIPIIEELFLNMKHKLLYKRFIKKAVWKIYKFFLSLFKAYNLQELDSTL